MADGNKTEKPTEQRRRKAREEGQVSRSRELGSVLSLVGAAVTLVALSQDMARHWSTFYNGLLAAAVDGDFTANGPILFWSAVEVLRWIVPVLLVAMVLSVSATLAQGGLNFAPAALQPKVSRMSPASRIGQIFSIATLGTLAKSLLPFLAIAVFGATAVQSHWSELARASGTDIRLLASVVGEILSSIAWKSALVLLAWAAVDYVLTWQQGESKLKMSKEEIKREYKENDGNPFTKGQIRKLQRAMRQRKPLEAAATATMVITNPTHFAVALRYESSMAAPEVVAKGLDLLAQKIKAIARENNVPTIENKTLARALYKEVEVGEAIPADLYGAVAEILVVVLRAEATAREQEEMRNRRNAAGEVVPPQ
ncbi:MAG: EscU/YscU/HrcU family type III secretion system export apparatus switch protein [Janthinobacterium lividum]